MKIRKEALDPEEAALLEDSRNTLYSGLRTTLILGVALLVNIASIIPFLAGHSQHEQFYNVGRPLLITAVCLLGLFLLAAGRACLYWLNDRELKKVLRKGS